MRVARVFVFPVPGGPRMTCRWDPSLAADRTVLMTLFTAFFWLSLSSFINLSVSGGNGSNGLIEVTGLLGLHESISRSRDDIGSLDEARSPSQMRIEGINVAVRRKRLQLFSLSSAFWCWICFRISSLSGVSRKSLLEDCSLLSDFIIANLLFSETPGRCTSNTSITLGSFSFLFLITIILLPLSFVSTVKIVLRRILASINSRSDLMLARISSDTW